MAPAGNPYCPSFLLALPLLLPPYARLLLAFLSCSVYRVLHDFSRGAKCKAC